MPETTGERWMGVPEAAEYLGVGMRTLYKFLDEGRIPRLQAGPRDQDEEGRRRRVLEANRIELGSLRHLYPPGVEDENAGEGS